MDIINKINSAVGFDTAKIESATEQIDAKANGLIKQIGVGVLGYSPVPVPFPKSSIKFNETHFKVPLGLAKSSTPEDVFWLPTDPQISINGGNTIIKREIANGNIKGTVKEMWRNNDWNIAIAGILISDDSHTIYDYMNELYDLCTARESLDVTCLVLNNQMKISKICVEKIEFKATSGTDNQEFTITAVSDDSYNLEVD